MTVSVFDIMLTLVVSASVALCFTILLTVVAAFFYFMLNAAYTAWRDRSWAAVAFVAAIIAFIGFTIASYPTVMQQYQMEMQDE